MLNEMDIHSTTATPELIADVNKPVLSLCIPTYNRRDKLARLLNGIKHNVEHAAGKIEVCISDNASTDGSNEFLKELSPCKYISVIRQSENVGFDRNYAAVFSIAKGNYVWILGDDDIIVENGLETLLQLLQNESPDYAFVHIVAADGDQPQYFPDMKPGKYPVSKLRSMLCKDGLDMFGFIGSHVFPKSSLDILIRNEDALTSGWPHLIQLLAASDKMESFLVTEPLARQISDGLFWSSTNWVLVSMRKIDILSILIPKWSDKNLKYFRLAKNTVLSNSKISNLVNAKIVESNRFSEIVDKAHYYFKTSKGTLKFVIFIYIVVIVCIKYLPVGFILSKLRPAYYRNKIKEYEDFHMEKSALEGYSREPAS
jgi:glycosyltransferase involved in cell wall biosynthesis